MKYRLIIDSKINRLDRVYRWLETLLNRKKVDLGLSQKILLVSQELVTNSILHGNRKISHRKVFINLYITPKRVILNITDEGDGTFKLPTKKQATKLDYLKECGRGLKLAVLMSDRILLKGRYLIVYFNKK